MVCNGKAHARRHRVHHFRDVNLINLIAAVCTNGKASETTLFVLKGTHILYRMIDKDNRYEVHTVHYCLQNGAFLAVRENDAPVDSIKFSVWARRLI